MLSRLRYRTKITLAFLLLALLGVALVSALFMYAGIRELESTRMSTGLRMASCLAGNIAHDMERDALYSLLGTLGRFKGGWSVDDRPIVVVLDDDERIYATTLSPARDYLAEPFSALGAGYGGLTRLITDPHLPATTDSPRGFFALAPILVEGERMGTLIVDYPLASLHAQVGRLLRLIVGYALVLLLGLWAIGWLLGRRMVRPLLSLTRSLRRVGHGDLDVHCDLGEGRDEFAELGRGFNEMVRGLREKASLEQEVVRSERLAAIGQVAAGMAHEINNPLGGMLNAISTYRKHGDNPDVAHKTLDLLDRGLAQLRATVQALLVNARLEDRALTAQDLDDIRTLVEPQARRARVALAWEARVQGPTGVPSSQVRQVLMNLVLNAIQATPEGGQVQVRCLNGEGELRLEVDDTGPGIPDERRAHLFEPFVEQARGTGLGLWVSFQIVSGLGGTILAEGLSPGTRLVVTLPQASERYIRDRHA